MSPARRYQFLGFHLSLILRMTVETCPHNMSVFLVCTTHEQAVIRYPMFDFVVPSHYVTACYGETSDGPNDSVPGPTLSLRTFRLWIQEPDLP